MNNTKSKQDSLKLIGNGSRREPSRDEIALFAYSIWEKEGRPQNHDVENWLRAEAQLRAPRTQDSVRV